MPTPPVQDLQAPGATALDRLADAARRPIGPVSTWWVGVLSGTCVLLGGVAVHGKSRGSTIDAWFVERLELSPTRDPLGYRVSDSIGTAGDPGPAALVGAALLVLCMVAGRPRVGVFALLGAALVDSTAILVKHLVVRTIHGANLSYPSTHAAHSTVVFVVLALLLCTRLDLGRRRSRVVVVVSGVLGGLVMSWALVAESVHYPTDTLAGIGVALALVPLVAAGTDALCALLLRARPRPGP